MRNKYHGKQYNKNPSGGSTGNGATASSTSANIAQAKVNPASTRKTNVVTVQDGESTPNYTNMWCNVRKQNLLMTRNPTYKSNGSKINHTGISEEFTGLLREANKKI